MRHLVSILAFLSAHFCYSQELDTFQNDSIYLKNKVVTRTMYQTNGRNLQKEMVINYNTQGQIIKRYWYWNGESNFHNVESFDYSNLGLLTSVIDSFADGNIEKTTLIYYGMNLKNKVTVNKQKDTVYFRVYPNNKTEIQSWYEEGKPYRFDTTIYEKENVKNEYSGIDCANPAKCFKWRYKFLNQFDKTGNLTRVWSGTKNKYSSFVKYVYDNRNLLIKKQEIHFANKKQIISTEYTFTYE